MASEVQCFYYCYQKGHQAGLMVCCKGHFKNLYKIQGPKELLEEFEKQYKEIMDGKRDD